MNDSINPPLPLDFIAIVREHYPQYAERLLESLDNTTATLSVRCNGNKRGAYGYSLEHLPLDRAIPWCADSYYLSERPFFAHDPLWHAGGYYVQEAASMALYQLKNLFPNRPLDVLDLSAAPGGKSTLIASIIPEGSCLIANEPIGKRAQILRENLLKWGYPHTMVTQAYPHQLSEAGLSFDVIVADAPCSGEGLFRKTPEARNEWSLQAVAECSQRQREILQSAWQMLRPNGLLCYSTCTFNPMENEENVHFLINEFGAEYIPLSNVSDEWQWIEGRDALGYHFLPGITMGEGFYFALLRKGACEEQATISPRNKRAKRRDKKEKAPLLDPYTLSWITSRYRGVRTMLLEETFYLLDEKLWEHYQSAITAGVPILMAGVPLCEQKGRKQTPSPYLAFSQELSQELFYPVEVTKEMALNYLSGEAITLPEGSSSGYCLITFEQVPLGFVNNLGNRANNLYPKAFRLKHLPK